MSGDAPAELGVPQPQGADGTGWIASRWIDDVALDAGFEPSIATGPNDVLHASWVEDSLPGPAQDFNVYHSSSVDSGLTWSSPVFVASTAAGRGAREPDITIQPDTGRIFIAYTEAVDALRKDVYVAWSDSGAAGTWASVLVHAEAGASTFSPSIVTSLGSAYKVFVAFDIYRGGDVNNRDVYVYRSEDQGGSYGLIVAVDGGYDVRMRPQLAIQLAASVTRLLLVSLYGVSASYVFQVEIRYTDIASISWFNTMIANEDPLTVTDPAIAGSRDGASIMVAWTRQDLGDSVIRYATNSNAANPLGPWDLTRPPISTFGMNDNRTALVADGEGTTDTTLDGRYHLLYTACSGSGGGICVTRYRTMPTDLSSGWSPEEVYPSEHSAVGRSVTTQQRDGAWYPAVVATAEGLASSNTTQFVHFTTPGGVRIETTPAGLGVVCCGSEDVSYTAPTVITDWPAGTTRTIDAPSPQVGGPGTRYVWQRWSDGGAQRHAVTPHPAAPFAAASVYRATFGTQYEIAIDTAPSGLQVHVDGSPTTAPFAFWCDAGYPHALSVTALQGSGNTRYRFASWSNGQPAAQVIPCTAALSASASFATEYQIVVDTSPSGLQLEVDGGTGTAPRTVWWQEGMALTVSAPSPQAAGPGVQFAWANWSHGGAQRQDLTPSAPGTYVARFTKHYEITIDSSPPGRQVKVNGTVRTTPHAFWCLDGAIHAIEAMSPQGGAAQRHVFRSWSDNGDRSREVTCREPTTLTATFGQQFKVSLQSDPPGVALIVDNQAVTTPREYWWDENSVHTVVARELARDLEFAGWTDGGLRSRSVTVTASATYIARYAQPPFPVAYVAPFPIAIVVVLVAYLLMRRRKASVEVPEEKPAVVDDLPEDWQDDNVSDGPQTVMGSVMEPAADPAQPAQPMQPAEQVIPVDPQAMTPVDSPAAPVQPTVVVQQSRVDETAARLAEVEQLRSEGLISEEEYMAKRKEILAKL